MLFSVVRWLFAATPDSLCGTLQLSKTIEYLQVAGVDVLDIDGTWLAGKVLDGWRMLAATVHTSHRAILPVAFTVCASESTDQVAYLLRNMVEHGLHRELKERPSSMAPLVGVRLPCVQSRDVTSVQE